VAEAHSVVGKCLALSLYTEWASKVPFQQGGTMIKPVWDGPETDTPTAARNDFQARRTHCVASAAVAACLMLVTLHWLPACRSKKQSFLACPAQLARTVQHSVNPLSCPLSALPLATLQIFLQERADDIHAANPSIFSSDRKAMLSAASVYWREQLTNEQRAEYRERAATEKRQAAEQAAEASVA
jgi:hypothetical protein